MFIIMFRVASKKVFKGDLLYLWPKDKKVVLKEIKKVKKEVPKKDVK